MKAMNKEQQTQNAQMIQRISAIEEQLRDSASKDDVREIQEQIRSVNAHIDTVNRNIRIEATAHRPTSSTIKSDTRKGVPAEPTKLLQDLGMANHCWAAFSHGACDGDCTARNIPGILHTRPAVVEAGDLQRIQGSIKAEEVKKQRIKDQSETPERKKRKKDGEDEALAKGGPGLYGLQSKKADTGPSGAEMASNFNQEIFLLQRAAQT